MAAGAGPPRQTTTLQRAAAPHLVSPAQLVVLAVFDTFVGANELLNTVLPDCEGAGVAGHVRDRLGS